MPTEAPITITELDVQSAFPSAVRVELLGRGAYGSTFRVVDRDGESATKVIHLPGMPDYLWERELSVLHLVDHPNLLKLLDSGFVEIRGHTLPYLRSEYLEGSDLRERMEQGDRPATDQQVRALLSGLLAGIGELHDLGGLHRDVKPANIVARDADWGRPVILDFGLARLVDMSTHTVYPSLIGTPRYMAPEQLRGKPARMRSDLFSIGVTVYEVTTGEHPYAPGGNTTPRDLANLILTAQPPLLSELNPEVTEVTSGVVARLMSFRGHERLSVESALLELER